MDFSLWRGPRRMIVVAILAGATAGCSGGGAGGTTAPTATADLANPPEVASVNGIAHVALSAVINPATGGPAIVFRGAFVPPTIRVNPGDTIDITYADQLPASSAEPLNATNLHFHGLATSPNPPADDPIDILAGTNAALRRSGTGDSTAGIVLLSLAFARRSELAALQRNGRRDRR